MPSKCYLSHPSIPLLFALPFLLSSLLRFITHWTPKMIFLEHHLHQVAPLITNLKWLLIARSSHLSICQAGPSATGSTSFPCFISYCSGTRTFWLWAAIHAGMFLSALLPLSHPPGMPFLALHPWTCPSLLCGSLSSLISNFTVSSGHFLCLYLFLINVTVYSSKTDQSPSLGQQWEWEPRMSSGLMPPGLGPNPRPRPYWLCDLGKLIFLSSTIYNLTFSP